jgi:hypothetical protein
LSPVSGPSGLSECLFIIPLNALVSLVPLQIKHERTQETLPSDSQLMDDDFERFNPVASSTVANSEKRRYRSDHMDMSSPYRPLSKRLLEHDLRLKEQDKMSLPREDNDLTQLMDDVSLMF